MRRYHQNFILIGVALLGLGSIGTTLARADLLSALLMPGASLIVGDKRFAEFTYLHNGDMAPPQSVTVTGVSPSEFEHGLIFTGSNFWDFNGGGSSTAVIHYTVTALDAAHLIIDNHLSFPISDIRITGPGGFSIMETLAGIGTKEVHGNFFANQPPDVKDSDTLTFSPRTFVEVTKTISAVSFGTGTLDSARVLSIQQTFTQQVPEPSSMMLWVMGAVGLLGCALRRQKRTTAGKPQSAPFSFSARTLHRLGIVRPFEKNCIMEK